MQHRQHHAINNLFIAERTRGFADAAQQLTGIRIRYFLRFTFFILFPAVEAEAVFLPKPARIKQDIDGVTISFLHARRKALRHDLLRVMGSIDTNHIQQPRRPHWPAKLLLHDVINLAIIRAVAQQQAESRKIGEQYPVNKETGTVVNHDRCFSHFAGPRYHLADGCF